MRQTFCLSDFYTINSERERGERERESPTHPLYEQLKLIVNTKIKCRSLKNNSCSKDIGK